MRCENCGRPMKNAELWQISGDPSAPTSSSMRHLCWDCRNKVAAGEASATDATAVAQASEIVRNYDRTYDSSQT